MLKDLSTRHKEKLGVKLCNILRLDQERAFLPEQMNNEAWEGVVRIAQQQGMTSLLYLRIKEFSIENRPSAKILRDLHDTYLKDSILGIMRLHKLGLLLRALRKDGIAVIALKGTHLAECVYSDFTLRPMADVDIMVKKSDLSRAINVLEMEGYQPKKKFWVDYEVRVSHEMPPFTQENGLTVELHWTLITPSIPFNIDLNGLWERAEPVNISKVNILGLSPEDLLLHLCMHASTQHRLIGGLRNSYDIALTINTFEITIDWNTVVLRASEWKAQRVAWLMFSLARDLFGAKIPNEILLELQASGHDASVEKIALSLLFPDHLSETYFSPWLGSLLGAENYEEKFRLILHRIFISPVEIARLYPVLPNSPKVFLYYPVRLGGMLKKHFRSAIGMLRGEPEILASATFAKDQQTLEELLIERLTN